MLFMETGEEEKPQGAAGILQGRKEFSSYNVK